MRFHKSATFLAPKTAWSFVAIKIYGPYCYTKRDALWQWVKCIFSVRRERKNPAWEEAPFDYRFSGPSYMREGFEKLKDDINRTKR